MVEPNRVFMRSKPSARLSARWLEIITCSTTLSSAKSCGFWNVLTMPKEAMLSGFAPLTLRPCQTNFPDVGTKSPARRLSNVVLPEPLGPRIPTISPCDILSETWDTATTPPNRLVRLSTSRNMTPTREYPDNAAWHHEDGQDQDCTIGGGPQLGRKLDYVRKSREQQR